MCGAVGGAAATELRVVSTRPYAADRELVAEYQHIAGGLEIKIDTSVGDNLVTKLLLDAVAGTGPDVLMHVPSRTLDFLSERDLLEPIGEPASGELARFGDPSTPAKWIAQELVPTVLCSNVALVETRGLRPTSWLDLTSRMYSGQIMVPDPRTSSAGLSVLMGWLYAFGGYYQRSARGGWEFVDAIDRNVVLYTRSDMEPCSRVAEGRIPLGVSTLDVGAAFARRTSLLEILIPEESMPPNVLGAAIMSSSPRKDEARRFVQWLASDGREYTRKAFLGGGVTVNIRGQSRTVDAYSYSSLLADVLRSPTGRIESKMDRLAVLAEWTARYSAKVQEP
jgi:iron(III) transport system substrate-binding protein